MRPTLRTETIRFLTLDELGRLLAVTRESVRDRAMFLLAYRHGLRASEVGLLRADDLDLRMLRLMVHRLIRQPFRDPSATTGGGQGAAGLAARARTAAFADIVPQPRQGWTVIYERGRAYQRYRPPRRPGWRRWPDPMELIGRRIR